MDAVPTRRSALRLWFRRLALAVFGTAVVGWVVGCTSTVTPPAVVADPVPVHLVFDDRHRGLVLPTDDGRFVEYGYGDWRWYAHQEDAWYDAFATVLWPTRGTLGRRITPVADASALRARFHWARFEELRVDRARMVELRDRLDRTFAKHAGELFHNPNYRMSFVPVDDSYWCCFNCNDAIAGWLRDLGCSVSWVPIRLDLAVDND